MASSCGLLLCLLYVDGSIRNQRKWLSALSGPGYIRVWNVCDQPPYGHLRQKAFLQACGEMGCWVFPHLIAMAALKACGKQMLSLFEQSMRYERGYPTSGPYVATQKALDLESKEIWFKVGERRRLRVVSLDRGQKGREALLVPRAGCERVLEQMISCPDNPQRKVIFPL